MLLRRFIRRSRRSRSRFRRPRRWRLVWLAALVLGLAAIAFWTLRAAPSPPAARIVTITLSPAGAIRLGNEPVSLAQLEARLDALQQDGMPVSAVIEGVSTPGGATERMLAARGISWLGMSPPSDEPGGDHGQ